MFGLLTVYTVRFCANNTKHLWLTEKYILFRFVYFVFEDIKSVHKGQPKLSKGVILWGSKQKKRVSVRWVGESCRGSVSRHDSMKTSLRRVSSSFTRRLWTERQEKRSETNRYFVSDHQFDFSNVTLMTNQTSVLYQYFLFLSIKRGFTVGPDWILNFVLKLCIIKFSFFL